MAKTREKKEKIIVDLDQKVQAMKSAVIVDYKGLKVKEIEELRNNLRKVGVTFNVSKNTLTKIALTKHGIEFSEGAFKKPVAVAFAMDDEVAPAKEIVLFAKKNEAIEIVGGILEKKYIDESMVRTLAALPTKEQLRGQVVSTIAAPLSGMMTVINGNLRGLVTALKELSEKKA